MPPYIKNITEALIDDTVPHYLPSAPSKRCDWFGFVQYATLSHKASECAAKKTRSLSFLRPRDVISCFSMGSGKGGGEQDSHEGLRPCIYSNIKPPPSMIHIMLLS